MLLVLLLAKVKTKGSETGGHRMFLSQTVSQRVQGERRIHVVHLKCNASVAWEDNTTPDKPLRPVTRRKCKAVASVVVSQLEPSVVDMNSPVSANPLHDFPPLYSFNVSHHDLQLPPTQLHQKSKPT